jgi:hypothetical protein
VIHDNDFILVGQTSSTLYIAHERREMPCFAMPLSPAEFNCDRPAFPRRPKQVNTIRQSAEAIASIHPDSLELTIARCIQNFIPELPRVNKGQFYGIRITPENSAGKREGASSEKIILLENPAHGAYIVTTLRMPLKVRYASELPIRCLGPLGYRYWFDSEDTLYINIPPESCIPIRIVD